MTCWLLHIVCALAFAGSAIHCPAGPKAGAPGCEAAPNYFSPPDEALYLQGRYVFQRNCVPCHGEFGDGKGPMGVTVVPRPRDFRSGIFKYRSTPSGALPTDDDLLRTVTQGIPGTAMPFFSEILTERDRRAVVQYVKTFSRKWRAPENFAAPLKIPDPPEWFSDAATFTVRGVEGKKLFATACASCHGANGDGKGEAAVTLEDVWGRRIVPADLRKPWIHSGRELTDIYKVLVTGLNGTPMASFADTTTEAQRWELVAYIESLRREFASPASKKVEVEVSKSPARR